MSDEVKQVGQVYLHLMPNSGIKFTVFDKGRGPVIQITISTFDTLTSTVEVYTDNKSLAALSKMFMDAALEKFSENSSLRASELK